MTSQDYIDWANEYQQEAESVENVINRKKQELESENRSFEKMMLCKTLKRLESQKAYCLNTARMLEGRARKIEEKEG